MNANTATSIMTKNLDDLALAEAVHASLVFGSIVVAVLLAFGIKTYVHWRRHPKTSQSLEPAAEEDGAKQPAQSPRQRPAPRIEMLPALGDLRGSGRMKRGLEDPG
ncbi:hypothetical protein [Glutamicibacter sp. BW77]|uniref:hypothetical protein n=1 Tax=Glutamicibacter TaxID=1742989 RepID=UPI000BB960D2|nr:hypothetical protein [Glutamicibacter sp. BW77]PCC37205.1 hypothetical protein CIK74_01825 [Glutamicibacter sp. BW77]